MTTFFRVIKSFLQTMFGSLSCISKKLSKMSAFFVTKLICILQYSLHSGKSVNFRHIVQCKACKPSKFFDLVRLIKNYQNSWNSSRFHIQLCSKYPVKNWLSKKSVTFKVTIWVIAKTVDMLEWSRQTGLWSVRPLIENNS